jgi:ankyrin repeat protein
MFRRFLIIFLSLGGLALAAGRSDIADAAMKGDRNAVRALLSRRADVNAPQIDGATALHWAAYKDDAEMADLLLRAGANVNASNREGITPMYLASLNGSSRMIERLMKAGADPKQRGPSGETMLMLAARNGNPDAITMLIAAGVDLNAREPLRLTTALMWAVEQKHPAAVAALLDGKADFKMKTGAAGIPRNYMASRVNTEQVEIHAKRYAEAAAAGRTYQEQIEWEKKTVSRMKAAAASIRRWRRLTPRGRPGPRLLRRPPLPMIPRPSLPASLAAAVEALPPSSLLPAKATSNRRNF